MSTYRSNLPQLGERLFLTDGGLETSLVFHEGLDLPCFAAFDLLKDEAGVATLNRYFEPYLAIAREHQLGFILDSATWRANPDWAERIGYSNAELADANRRGIGMLLALRAAHETRETPIVVSGTIGPRGDGYRADMRMSADAARAYHSTQVRTFAETDADFVSAFTLNYIDEAIGIVQAAREADIPAVISFTVETDGRLPSGEALAEAVERTDAATEGYAAYYMINCAHPTHFATTLDDTGRWLQRLKGLRANASCLSHAELDESIVLDEGNPAELGSQYAELLNEHPQLRVVGGCCGTSHRHISEIARASRQGSDRHCERR
jgi:homocysteine S-methyltransferase